MISQTTMKEDQQVLRQNSDFLRIFQQYDDIVENVSNALLAVAAIILVITSNTVKE